MAATDFSPLLAIRSSLFQYAILAWSLALQGGDVNLLEEPRLQAAGLPGT